MSNSSVGRRYFYSVGDGGVSLVEELDKGYLIAHFRDGNFYGYRSTVPNASAMKPCYIIACSGYLRKTEGVLVTDNSGDTGTWLEGMEMMKLVSYLKGNDKYRLMRFLKGGTTGGRVSQVFLVFDASERENAKSRLEGVLSCVK